MIATAPDDVRLTYLGTAMVLIEVAGLRLLTDPVLDPAGSRYDDGGVLLEKTGAPPITIAALGSLDAVLLSHDQHSDNLDRAGRDLLAQVPKVLTTPDGAARLGGNAAGLAPWQTVELTGSGGRTVTITALPAQHAPEPFDAVAGPVTGFLIQPAAAGSIYVSGDTIPFAGTEEIAARCAPVALAVLHVGRVRLDIAGDTPFSMSAQDAIHLAEAIDATQVVPIHFEGWAHFTEGLDEAEAVFAASAIADRTRILREGEAGDFRL